MEEKIVLKGITRTTGTAEGEALVSEMPLSWAPCSILNDGTITMPDNPVSGQNVKDKIIGNWSRGARVLVMAIRRRSRINRGSFP